jgi:hypothetical protein
MVNGIMPNGGLLAAIFNNLKIYKLFAAIFNNLKMPLDPLLCFSLLLPLLCSF